MGSGVLHAKVVGLLGSVENVELGEGRRLVRRRIKSGDAMENLPTDTSDVMSTRYKFILHCSGSKRKKGVVLSNVFAKVFGFWSLIYV